MPASSSRVVLSPRRHPAPGAHPDPNSPAYRATEFRHPKQPLIIIPQTLTELIAPVYGHERIGPVDHDLTRQHGAPPLGQRIIVSGRVLDEDEKPVPNTLIEVWQANAAGRYAHTVDRWDAPLDPNFTGAGRTLTDGDGRYSFVSIQPGAYPWRNHDNAWRPAHIHFSLFGQAFATRLVTQMYFPGDPLLPLDPIFNSVTDARARERMVSAFDLSLTTPEWALGYRFDIILRGPAETPMERQP
ncbi:MAG TPA: protocatechuate 3,4-dioxygenase subunit beta [Vicinamibacterales bacterium]